MLKEFKFFFCVGSVDFYYIDVIGNVLILRFRSNKWEVLFEIKFCYFVFGGWKYFFIIGWNLDVKNFLRKMVVGGFVLNVFFFEGFK